MRKFLGTGITVLLFVSTVIAGCAALYNVFHPGFFGDLPARKIAYTSLVLLGSWIISRVIDRIAVGMSRGQRAWQKKLRNLLNVDEGEPFREVDLTAALLHLSIWLLVPLALLFVWGLSAQSFSALQHLAWSGFTFGQVQIVPAQLILGALLLVILTALIRWVTGRMEHHWLAATPMETHTREAVSTITGYVLFLIAALVVLSYVGLDLTKLAFIAGALSVGIGFGLQTIVNNFVSGLILLFEQPVRRGNFVTIGETEGFVRRIRIRATEIETLDRTTVAVPNAELLTLHLKNWNLRDRYGRIICAVGVAYGSDVRLVERLLIDVANKNPDVLSQGQAGVPKPAALFIGFGDSTLDFELRCFVRDVTRRFFVRSDLNFAIDAAFRAHDITIAFPQMDIWHRSVPREALSVATRNGPAADPEADE